MAVSFVGLGAFAGLAGASAGFTVTVAPTHVKPGGKVVITTTPRMACKVTLTLVGKKFSHTMPYGLVTVTLPRGDMLGRVPVQVSCAGHVVNTSFTVK